MINISINHLIFLEAEQLHLKDVADTEHLNRENQQLHAGREPV